MAGANGTNPLKQFDGWLAKQQALDNCQHLTTRTEQRGPNGRTYDVTVCATCGDVVP